MHFQISLTLWELQVTKDLWRVRDIAEKSSNRLLLLLIFKKNRVSLETNCVGVPFFTWNQLCWSPFLTKLHAKTVNSFYPHYFHKKFHIMVLNTPLTHKLSIYYYNINVSNDPSDYRSSRPQVFCKKGVHRNFTKFTRKHLCQSLFFNKAAALRPLL